MWRVYGKFFKFKNEEDYRNTISRPGVPRLIDIPNEILLEDELVEKNRILSPTMFDDIFNWNNIDEILERKLSSMKDYSGMFIKMHHPYYICYVGG